MISKFLNQDECFKALEDGYILVEKNRNNWVYLNEFGTQIIGNVNRKKAYKFDNVNTWRVLGKRHNSSNLFKLLKDKLWNIL